MNKKEQMYQRIKEHGEKLNIIFDTGLEPIELCKKLRRAENKAHRLAEDYCNGLIDDDGLIDPQAKIRKSIIKILNLPVDDLKCPDDMWPIIHNLDPRGYALKIKDSYVREYCLDIYRDFGGYGILAPDLS